MQRLILLRHGQAERVQPGGEDFERCLTAQGRIDAGLVGARLAEEGLAPDRVLLSAATRTRQTWEAMDGTWPEAQVEAWPALYLAGAEQLRQAAVTAGETADTVMVVAHNPGLQELALRFLREGSAPPSVLQRFTRGFPPATAAVFQIDAAGRPAYDGLFLVRDLGGGGRE